MKLYLCIFFVLNLSVNVLRSQGIDTSYIASYNSADHLYKFKANIYDADLNFKANVLKLAPSVSIVLDKSTTDALGMKHLRYHQRYNEATLVNSDFVVHLTSNVSTSASGELFSSLSVGNYVIISAAQAIDDAISANGASQYAWQNALWEARIKTLKNDPSATYYPTAQLVVINSNMMNPSLPVAYKYAYKVDLLSLVPAANQTYYIDAGNGSVLLIYNNILTCSKTDKKTECSSDERSAGLKQEANLPPPCAVITCVPGTANIYYAGVKQINTYQYNISNTCRWSLSDGCVPGVSGTIDADNLVLAGNVTDNTSNTWGTTQREATTGLFNLRNVLEYYNYVHGRNSYDDLGSSMLIGVKDQNFVPNNAGYVAAGMIYVGDPGGVFTSPMESNDVIGHEFTHGITTPITGLVTSIESGAIAESLSDIMGTMADQQYKLNNGGTPDWMIGDECTSGGLRSMSNPNLFNDPDTYLGTYWAPGTIGYHELGGVINYWYYLLCDGGAGTNDVANSFCVKGITKMHAEQIMYRYINFYLTPNETFSSMRAKTIQAAIDLYGRPDHEFVAQLTSAWYAVGVGPAFSGLVLFGGPVASGASVTWAYNKALHTNVLAVSPSANVLVTSGDQILFETDYVYVQPGSVLHAYITPGCAGGARMASAPTGNGSSSAIAGVAEAAEAGGLFEFAVMPNPNNGEFKVTLNSASALPASVVVMDIMGRVVSQISHPDSYELDFNMQAQAGGIYLIKADYESSVAVKRIVKK